MGEGEERTILSTFLSRHAKPTNGIEGIGHDPQLQPEGHKSGWPEKLPAHPRARRQGQEVTTGRSYPRLHVDQELHMIHFYHIIIALS